MTTYRGDRLDLELDEVLRLDVRIVAGEVNVTAGAGRPGSIRLEVEVLRGGDVDVELAEDGTLVVDHQPVRKLGDLLAGGTLSVKANITIVAPEGTPTHVRTVSGDVFVGGITAGTSITTVSGRITATGLDEEVALKSVSGDVEVQGVGGAVRVNTVSGDLTISGGDPSEVRVKAVSGDVTLDLDGVPAADLDCMTVSGDVAVRLPAGAGLDLDAVTVSGRLETNFPDGGLDGSRRRLRGRIGDGGARLTARTTSGDVIVLQRTDASLAARGLDR